MFDVQVFMLLMTALYILASFVVPPILVALSGRVRGYDKFCWAVLSLFTSWIGFSIFMIVQTLRPASSSRG